VKKGNKNLTKAGTLDPKEGRGRITTPESFCRMSFESGGAESEENILDRKHCTKSSLWERKGDERVGAGDGRRKNRKKLQAGR